MSDEQNPPSLRLKPRQPPASAVPPPVTPDPVTPRPAVLPDPSISAPAATAKLGVDESGLMNLRLKPKTPTPEAPLGSAATYSTPVPFSTSPVVPAVPATFNPAPVSSVGAPPPTFGTKLTPPVLSPTSMPSPISSVKPPYLPTPRNLATSVATPPAKSPPPAVKADKLLAGIVLVVLVVAGIFYGLPYLTRSKPKSQPDNTAASASPASVSKPAPAPTAPKLVDKPVSAAGKMIATARDIVAAHDSQGNEVATILEGTSTAAKTPDNATPATAIVPPVPAAPVVPPPPAPPPPPTEAFRQFVVNLRVNGIFQGENARAMLNNKMVHPGDVVNSKLAITLLRIDVDTKALIFCDDTGATVTRRF